MTITADKEKTVVDGVPTQLFIGGEWRDAAGGATLDVEDPSTGESIASVADATPEDATAALDACAAVQAEWAAHPPRERGEILRRAWEKLTERSDDLALLMTLEMGKPLAESKAEIAYAGEFFRWFAEEAVRIEGRYATAPNGAGRLITMRQPVGPCYAITPWNFPMAMGTRKIGPAIAAGCTMVIKPAQQTPLSMLALAEDPRGGRAARRRAQRRHLELLQRRLGADHRRPAAAQAHVHRLDGGRAQARRAVRPGLLRTSMELGGNAPFLVFADADVDAAVEGALIAKMRNIGEACTAANRFHVAGKVARRVHREARGQARRDAGRPRHRGGRQGRAADRRRPALEGRRARRGRAASKGAEVVLGGTSARRRGLLLRPDRARRRARTTRGCSRRRSSGPVAPVATFDDEDAAIAAANDTEFGLVAYVYTSDVKRAFRVCEKLETGMVGLNQGLVSNPAAPFGGVKRPASAARAAPRASTSTSRSSTSR